MNKIPIIMYGSWGLLGSYRGIKYYNFRHEEEMKYYLKDTKNNKKPQDFYSSKITVAALWTVIYILPFCCILPATKEIKRLEIYLRGLEEEKKKPEYYNLF